MTLLGAAAALFLKKAADGKGLRGVLRSGSLYTGGGLYAGAALINIYLLRRLDYAAVVPLTSLTSVWTVLLSRIVFKEPLTIRKGIALTGIVIGAMLIV